MRSTRAALTCLVGLLLLLWCEHAYADGYRIPYQGAAAAGQGEAFSAQADDPSALHYNPAGLTQVRRVQVYAGTNLVTGYTTYTGPAGETARGDLGGTVAFPPPGNLYVTANLEDLGIRALGPMTVGLGLASPFGLTIRWPNDGPFSSAVTSATLPLMDIKPTVAYKIAEWLSIGLGADIYTFAPFLGEGGYEAKNVFPGVGAAEVNGKDTALGFNVSALFTPLRIDGKPRVNLGVVYRKGVNLDVDGRFLVNGAHVADATTRLVLPDVVTGALAVWPIRDDHREWKLEFDMDFVGWSGFRSLDTRLSNGTFVQIPQNWKDTYTLSAGTEYKWLAPASLPHWDVAVRLGYQRSNHAVPAGTFNPTVADANWNIFAAGLGLLCKQQGKFLGLLSCGSDDSPAWVPKAIGLDLAFQAAVWESRAIAGNINPTVNGTYDTKSWYIGSFNIRLMF